MMKKRTYLGISIYALSMLIILAISVAILGGALYRAKQTEPKEESEILAVDQTTDLASGDTSESREEESQTDTESSIFQESENAESESDTESEPIETWVVKEYMGQIGVFKPDGSLEVLLDTYVKTLPKADQALLGEGFEIQGRTQLNEILQDYGD